MLGSKLPKSEIVYFCKMIVVYVIIVVTTGLPSVIRVKRTSLLVDIILKLNYFFLNFKPLILNINTKDY